jgi:hypothetical protein
MRYGNTKGPLKKLKYIPFYPVRKFPRVDFIALREYSLAGAIFIFTNRHAMAFQDFNNGLSIYGPGLTIYGHWFKRQLAALGIQS